MSDNAAEALVGQLLKNRWKVIKKIDPPPGSTGGFFSVCYIVEDEDGQAFLKALDFKAFFAMFPGRSVIEIIQEQSNAFQYEKELLHRCRNRNLSKVSTILDEGEAYIAGFIIPNVPFLVFEMADGDIRSQIDFTIKLHYAWKLRSLHNVAVGISQLHSVKIGHQDLKPSNILLYDNKATSKIGDLGRSLCNDILAPHENGNFPGDFNYAPPEFWYNERIAEWDMRIKTTDLYLFGSLIVFYFTGLSMTTLLMKHLPLVFRPDTWGGNYNTVLPHLIDAYSRAIIELKASVGDTEVTDDIVKIVEYCCHPEFAKRGHPKTLSETNNKFDLARIVTLLDIYARKAEIKLL